MGMSQERMIRLVKGRSSIILRREVGNQLKMALKCPVCGKEAKTRLYYCAKCAVYVHTACWQEHVAAAHKK